MRKFINLAAAAIGIMNIGFHVTQRMGQDESIFSFTVSSTAYLAFWGILTVLCIYGFIQQQRIDSRNKS